MQAHAVFIINWTSFTFFLVDMLMKIFAHGFLLTPNSYLTVGLQT